MPSLYCALYLHLAAASKHAYRWAKDYEAVDLAQLPHRRLSRPCRAFEYFFEGVRRARGRENVLRLPIVAAGTVNAVAFWFDLHLDDEESITTGGSLPTAILSFHVPSCADIRSRRTTQDDFGMSVQLEY